MIVRQNGDQMQPKLTAFTIAMESAADCRPVIEDLRRQTAREEIELIVVAPDREGLPAAATDGFWGHQWILLPEVRECGKAMAAAVRAARAPFAVYAEEHATFDPAWAVRLLAAHRNGYDVVGFAMENANPGSLTSWAHLYGQFGPVVAPVESGESDFLAGHHVSYKVPLLLEYGELLPAMLEDESALLLDLRRRGVKLYIAGDAVSRHVNISRLTTYVLMDFTGQRSFAAARAAVGRWPWWRRILYAGAAPLLPLVRGRRILRHLRRTGRDRALLPRILLPIGAALLAGACGEALGYLLGGGRSALRKAPIELRRELYLKASDLRRETRAESA